MSTRSIEQSYLQYKSTSHFGSLNGLRFVCIAAILWHHAPIWTSIEAPAQILTRGFVGVDFFFVLSGFLITTLLLREADAKGSFSLRGFYWRRFLRIIPVYYLVITAVALYYIGLKGQTQYLAQLPYYYLFLSNFLPEHMPMLYPTWSLAVEEQYYLVWPLLLMLLPRPLLIPFLVFTIGLNVIAVIGWLTPLGIAAIEAGPLRFAMFNATYAPILIGSGLALILHSRKGFDAICGSTGNSYVCVGSFLVLLASLQWLPEDVRGWPNLVMHLIMAVALASIVVREDHVLRPVLTIRPFVRIGEISYGVYLYHLIALHIAKVGLGKLGMGDQNWVILVVYSLLAIAISEASFRTFERYFLSFKHRAWGTSKLRA